MAQSYVGWLLTEHLFWSVRWRKHSSSVQSFMLLEHQWEGQTIPALFIMGLGED